MNEGKRSALIFGATGLVGNELLHILLDSSMYESVCVLGRTWIATEHPKLTQQVVDFNALENFAEVFAVDDVFCCLGTTIKKAGSQKAFKKVDFEYPLQVAKLAKQNGVKQFLIISAIGANKDSKVFYNRIKGEIEMALEDVFIPSLHIFRPSLLLGKRKEFRLGESFAEMISPIFATFLIGRLRKYKPIQAKDVAMAMYETAKGGQIGRYVYDWDQMYFPK